MMSLKHASRSQRALSIDGWNLDTQEWDPCVARGSIHANDMYITGRDYTLKNRVIACSDEDRIDPKYGAVQIDGLPYIVESESKNSWRKGVYQYVYQMRRADLMASLYEMVSTPQASGMPGQPVRTLYATTLCDTSAAGAIGSSEIDELDYSRVNIHLPGNIRVDKDVEVDIQMDTLRTFDLVSTQRFNLCTISTAIQRGVSQ